MRTALIAAGLAGAVLSGGPAIAGPYTFTTLDALPLGNALISTTAYGINNAGQVVGRYDARIISSRGFLYDAGSFSPVDAPTAGCCTSAFGINAAGQIVGGYQDSSGVGRNFLYSYSAGTYTEIIVPEAFNTSLHGINDAGQVVGGYRDASGSHGFLDSGGVFTNIDVPGASSTFAARINAAGQIVGGYADASGNHGFLYSAGTFTTIDVPGATHGTEVWGINASEQIVGNYDDAIGRHGFLYSAGTFTTIDVPGATRGTNVFGINDAGQIVGDFSDNNGQIALNGTHGFLATPSDTSVPEPASLALAIPGLLGLGLVRRRQRPCTSGQPPSAIGRNALSAGIVATSL